MAVSRLWLGRSAVAAGKPAEAEAEFRTALAIYQKLADEDTAVIADFRAVLRMPP